MSSHAFAVADQRLVNAIVVACHAAGKAPVAVAYDGASFVGLAQADFIALTQNQRDRMLFDVVTALIRVQRAMLRDG
jgi:hypothetical protein